VRPPPPRAARSTGVQKVALTYLTHHGSSAHTARGESLTGRFLPIRTIANADYIAVFKFFLDDSARGGVFAVGGYVAHISQWEKFEEEWRPRLRQAGVDVFHATDFYNAHGEFKGWDYKKQIKFAKLFTAIAEKQTEIGIAHAIDVAAFNELLAPILAARYWTPHGKVTPLIWCTRTVLAALVNRHSQFVPPTQPLQIIFETGDGVGEAIDYFRGLKERGAPWLSQIVSFADGDKRVLPLQAADLIVHEAVRSAIETIHPSGRAKRKSMLRLVEGERVEVRVLTRQNAVDAVPAISNNIQGFDQP
jgi:hypothetical protein